MSESEGWGIVILFATMTFGTLGVMAFLMFVVFPVDPRVRRSELEREVATLRHRIDRLERQRRA